MPPWLQRLLGVGESGLSESISTVLGRNQPTHMREIHPNLRGGYNYPVKLDDISSYSPEHDPFVSDTLSALVGGRVPIKQGYAGIVLYPGETFGQPAAASANPLTRSIRYREGQEESIPHEFGHIFDFRNVDPQLEMSVRRRFGELEEGEYSTKSPREHFASAFSEAVDMLRYWSSFSSEELEDPEVIENFLGELESYDMTVPGTREMVLGLGQNPIYGGKFLPLFDRLRAPTRQSFLNADLGPQ